MFNRCTKIKQLASIGWNTYQSVILKAAEGVIQEGFHRDSHIYQLDLLTYTWLIRRPQKVKFSKIIAGE